MYDTIPVAIIKSTGNLSAKLSRLLLFQSAVGDDVVQHLTSIDIFKEHIPVIVRSHDITHGTYVRMAQKSDDRSFSCRSNLLRMIGTLAVSIAVMFIGRLSWHYLDRNLMELISSFLGTHSGRSTYLLTSFYVLRQFHLSHASSTDGFTQSPLPGLRGDCRASFGRCTTTYGGDCIRL